MKLLYNALKEFVDIPDTPAELRSRLSLSGLSIDSIEETPAGPLLDAEVTINRPDCMGHYGVAREVATIYRRPLKPIEPKFTEVAQAVPSVAHVEIACPDLCRRYTARVLRGVKVQPSPAWLRQRLESMGHASINNVVDATNYVMLELGHPMHAFDRDRLTGQGITVRRAARGEKIKTLDGMDRVLTADMCVIADASRAIAIGGVMGGQSSEIGFVSQNILLEAAWFDPISIRRTAKTLGLRTEASIRFERGADLQMAEVASRRCAELIQQLAGGEILAGVVDVYPGKWQTTKISLSRRELLRVMGAGVPDAEIESILTFLGFSPKRVGGQAAESSNAVWECTQPSWRADVTREIDLVEEVVRHYGLDKFPPRLPATRTPAARLLYAEADDLLRERLCGLGYQEISTIPLMDNARDALFRPQSDVPVHLANPLAEDASVMRTSGVANMTTALEWNLNRGQRNLRLFEIGRGYRWNGVEPEERLVLTLGVTGFAREKSVSETAREFGFADLKGDLDRLGELAGNFRWSAGSVNWLHPARSATLKLSDGAAETLVGCAGQLSRDVAAKLKLRQEVFLAEISLDPFYSACSTTRAALKYQPISRYPAVERDFSLVLADGVTFAQVVSAIRALGVKEIMDTQALDVFRGGQVPTGQYSLLVRVTFQSYEATLTEAQLAGFSSRIAATLSEKLGASLRTT
jgi:phenylalanyl-tRNA synthetase beta chain